MNIYQTVIDSVAASAGDITESAGSIIINGSTKLFIPKNGVVAARRIVAGEKVQVWTVTIPSSPSNSTTYTISVAGKSPVTGIMKTFTATYTTSTSATQLALSNGLAASLVSSEAPYTVSGAGTGTLTITAKSGTPVISVASNLLTVANATAGLATPGTAAAITTAGVVSGTGTNYDPELPVGAAFYASNTSTSALVSLTGFVSGVTSDTVAQVVPNPSGTLTIPTPLFASGIYLIDNTGATIENTYAYAALPGVTLTAGTRYVVYEIDAIAGSDAGNGARPDTIESKYVIYVKSTDANVWPSSNGTGTGGFDLTLATKCGLSNF